MNSGKMWMIIWLAVLAGMICWGILTAVFWMDSVRNINALSIVANVGMGAAGLQASLAMRKADRKDQF